MSAFSRSPPLTAAMNVIPSSASRNVSAGPNASTMGQTIGTSAASRRPPTTPPTADEVRLAPIARPASPRRAIGIAVHDDRRVRSAAGNAEQNARKRSARVNDRVHGHQKHRARDGVHAKDERNRDRDAELAADAWNRADDDAEAARQATSRR